MSSEALTPKQPEQLLLRVQKAIIAARHDLESRGKSHSLPDSSSESIPPPSSLEALEITLDERFQSRDELLDELYAESTEEIEIQIAEEEAAWEEEKAEAVAKAEEEFNALKAQKEKEKDADTDAPGEEAEVVEAEAVEAEAVEAEVVEAEAVDPIRIEVP